MAASSQKKPRSIYASILVPLISLLVVEIVLFASTVGASGVFSRLTQNNQDILSQQVLSRKDNLENYLVGTVGDLSLLANTLNATTQEMLDAGELDLNTLDMGASETTELIVRVHDTLVSTLRTKRVNGVYLIFNTHSLASARESGAYGKKPGVYIYDMDPTATPSRRNEDLVIERGSTEIVESSSITSGNEWSPLFNFQAIEQTALYDFFYLPWQTAYDAGGPLEAGDYAYWGTSLHLGTGGGLCMSYSIPLVLSDGTVYGVAGVDLSTSYIQSLLPYSELLGENESSYVLGVFEEENPQHAQSILLQPAVLNGRGNASLNLEEALDLQQINTGEYLFSSQGKKYYAAGGQLRLYSSNAPFENKRWMLVGVTPESALHSFTNQVLLMIGLASLLMLLAGVIGSIILGRSISNPIKSLAHDVETAQVHNAEMPELARTGITEVDSLTSAISTLSKDIASVKQLEQQRIEHERDYDLLTGLMNRRALYREADKVFASADTVGYAALVLLDLDDLKEINDTYGHDLGDKYIYQAARCFEESVPDKTYVARVAGDEFFVLFYGYQTRKELEEDILALRDAIPQHTILLPGGENMNLSASGGVAFYPEDGKEFTELMRLADFAMYQIKIAGKNNIGFFDITNYQEQSSIRRALAELEDLLSNNELSEYHFQPIIDARTGGVFAYEALMRVAMENLRCPEDVLTLARQEGRLSEVEELTWARSFECFGQLQERGEVDRSAYLFVNSFANIVIDSSSLDKLVLDYPDIIERLVIEITEAENMDDEVLAKKRAIPGFSGLFALDDYGTGYNSEIMLLDLKPQFVKVDISIIRDIDTSIDKQRIVSNVVEYAHERGMRIVAEGIETAAELAMLLSLDVDLLQGFYLARPSRLPGQVSPEAYEQIKQHRQLQ